MNEQYCYVDEVDCYVALRRLYENGGVRLTDCNLFSSLIEEHFNPKPYKFEDLKEGMWVYDNKFKEICWIEFVDRISTGNGLIKIIWGEYLKSHLQGDYMLRTEFEENRFYPVTKAMQ